MRIKGGWTVVAGPMRKWSENLGGWELRFFDHHLIILTAPDSG